MSEENNAVTVDDAQNVLEMDENVAHVDAAHVGETVVPIEAAKAIKWVNLPDAASLKQHILNHPDLAEEVVQVPEWECEILIRGMTGKQRADLVRPEPLGVMRADGTTNIEKMYPVLLTTTCYHPVTRELLFNAADRDTLNTKAGTVLERLAMVAARLSGMDTSQAGQQGDVRKN